MRAVVARSPASLLSYGFFVGVPLLTFAAMLATGYDIQRQSPVGLPAWAAMLLGPAFVFVILPLCHAINVWQMRRRNASIRGDLRFAVTDDGFESHGGSFDVRLRWDAIHRVVETKHFFLFYVASAMAHFLPKACIGSTEELQTIRALIHDALSDKARLRAD
jgi:hypothetical protein